MASAVEKPVIVLLHGAWHQPVHFDSFASQLRLEGFEVLVPRLASAGPDNEIIGKTLQDDVQVIHDTIKPYLNRGRQIVLVSHSLSGMTATDSAIGYTVTDRTDICQPGGIKAIIYISAVAPPMAGMYGLQMRTYEDVPPEWWQVEVG
jgi:pimeloyl-ACP methyl ester carboxylesterase